MRRPQTLRGRLTLAYATSLVLALVAFAALALIAIDQSQRRALDAQLASIATTAQALVEPADLQVASDERDRSQLTAIAGARVNGAILRRDGATAISSTYAIPPAVRATAVRASHAHYASLRISNDTIRLYVVPEVVRGVRIGTIAIWRDAEAIDNLDRSIAIAFALAIPAIAGVAIVGGSAIARRGLAPLAEIAERASEIEAHDLTRRLDLPPRNDELGQLAATLDRMLDRLQRAFDRERRFTSDASHELRAPLSVIRAEADLALRRERDGAEYRRALETIAAESDALELLTRDLLAAARVDADVSERREPVDVGAIASGVARRFAVVARERGIAVTERVACDRAIFADPTQIERALVALVDNAVKYSRDGGTVAIDIAHAGNEIVVQIADDGRGFTSEALERAFDRFWRDDDVRTMPGSGLGLGIARSIVERCGGALAIANRPDGGALVTVQFPARDDIV